MPSKNIDVCLVIPTIRKNCLDEFISRWNAIGLFEHVDLMIMEDNPTQTFETPEVAKWHFAWSSIESNLGENSWIIPRRSDTVRSFGYLRAWEFDYKFILTLDDDCYPCTAEDGLKYDGAGFVNAHKAALVGRTRWFNTLNSVKPRGIPYYNLGTNRSTVLNHGLWTNVLDYDAPYQLANPIKEKFSFDNQIVPAGSYFPMCGMNVMWKREITVLMYHLLMGHAFNSHPTTPLSNGSPRLEKLPFDRFGDIWAGILMKKVTDALDMQVSTGMPYIRHERASNPFTNLKKEANGIEVNEKFWEYVDGHIVCQPNPSRAYWALGGHIAQYQEFKEYNEYFADLGKAMQIWAGLLREESDML